MQGGQGARARVGRHAAVSRVEVGGIRALHRAFRAQRHTAALIIGHRSAFEPSEPLIVLRISGAARSGWRFVSPIKRSCCDAAL